MCPSDVLSPQYGCLRVFLPQECSLGTVLPLGKGVLVTDGDAAGFCDVGSITNHFWGWEKRHQLQWGRCFANLLRGLEGALLITYGGGAATCI